MTKEQKGRSNLNAFKEYTERRIPISLDKEPFKPSADERYGARVRYRYKLI